MTVRRMVGTLAGVIGFLVLGTLGFTLVVGTRSDGIACLREEVRTRREVYHGGRASGGSRVYTVQDYYCTRWRDLTGADSGTIYTSPPRRAIRMPRQWR